MFIRQAAFDGNEQHLKGGLHIHTTRSDGNMDAADVVRLYHELGYDFISLTDHYVYNRSNRSPETPITVIPGCEGGANISMERGFRTYHTVMIGPDDASNGFGEEERVPEGNDLVEGGIVKDQYAYQPYLDMIHGKGNLTVYCHPEWSCTPARCFEDMKGNFALEIWNTACVLDDYIDRDAPCWDEILRQGKRIYGVATDDSHSKEHCGGGWVMVRAENNIPSILSALNNGAFYSSCGPKIYDFYLDGDKLHISCDPVSMISRFSDYIPTTVRGEGMTEYTFTVSGKSKYYRLSVTDAEGRMAWTNPIYLD